MPAPVTIYVVAVLNIKQRGEVLGWKVDYVRHNRDSFIGNSSKEIYPL